MTIKKIFIIWCFTTASLASYMTINMFFEDEKSAFLPDETTHGHYQIELKCAACHTPMMGVKQDACLGCHQEELELSQDSHPETKFNDPRNFDMVAKLDARKCITCHTEHRPDITHKTGVTLPKDYCQNCHENISLERESHKKLKFDSCSTSGCHNYHDNTALYEDFLLSHFNESDLRENGTEISLNKRKTKVVKDTKLDFDVSPIVHHNWESTTHAKSGVSCKDCHQPNNSKWTEKVSFKTCQECHESEAKGFLEGKHGMRLKAGLSPMTPEMARLPMNKNMAHAELNCISCHSSHRFDIKEAAVESCLKCHNDKHSLNYKQSPHYTALLEDSNSRGKGVSCATCHMPRISKDGKVSVQHNQNATLRPNSKMVRTSCIKCHGLQFSLDSLADEDLIQNNFNGRPKVHVKSLDWTKKREQK